jgi:hypothetical protein
MTDNIEQKPNTKKRINFSVGGDGDIGDTYNLTNITGDISTILGKSVQPQIVQTDIAKKYDKSKIAFSTRDFYRSANGIETKGHKRISDYEQKELAQLDPYISAIISKRTAQATIISRRSESKYDKGCRIAEIDPLKQDDFDDLDQYKRHQNTRKLQMHSIMRWVQTCGNNDKELLDSVFSGMDPTFKKCSFPEFVAAQIRNLLTFGRCGSQIFRDDSGLPVLFRPLAIETIYTGDPEQDLHLGVREEVSPASKIDADALNNLHEDQKPQYYVQRIEGQNINVWTEDDIRIWYFQKQAYWDLNGYPLSPIELAIYMIFIHQQTLGYLRNQFVKGLATKGIISLETAGDASSDLGPEDMDQIRRDFHNYLLRNDNSAATPILSGPFKVNFVPLSLAPQDMGFLQLEEHIVRALCSAFQISPQEMGYGNLSIGQGGLNQANKQEEIIRGEETGLRMLLDVVFDGVNDIIYENFPEAKELYRLTYVGVGEDTRDSAIQRQQAEVQTTATLSSLWSDSEKNNPVPYGGDVPLNPVWHQNVVRYMKYGMFLEMFFGEENASKRPEYDFIIDPNLNQAYQQLRVTPLKQQQEQAQLQLEQSEVQTQQIAQQMQMEQQQAQQGVPAQGQPQQEAQPEPQQEGSDEEVEKSLSDEYQERRKLKKSLSNYLGEWMDFNKDT